MTVARRPTTGRAGEVRRRMGNWLAATFAALHSRPYRRLWVGMTFSALGVHALQVARGFLAFELTDSNAALGGLFLAFGLPMLSLMLWGGVVADRVAKRTLLLLSVTLFAIQIAVVASLILTDRIEYWMLLVQSAGEGTTLAFMAPTQQALVGELVDEDKRGNALALQQVSFSAARVVAPAAAGGLIAWPAFGVGGVYVVASVMVALFALAVAGLPARKPERAQGSPIADLLDGVRYMRSRPALWVLALTAYIMALTIFPYFVFLPALVKDVFDRGPFELGLLNAAAAAGALPASLVVASIPGRPRAWELHAGAAIAFALLLGLFSVMPSFPLAVVAIVGVGAAEISFFSLNVSLAITFAHREYHGRVQSLLLWSFSLLGLISLPLGIVADVIGVRQTLFVQSLVGFSLLVALQFYARRIGARADARPPSAAAVGAGGRQRPGGESPRSAPPAA